MADMQISELLRGLAENLEAGFEGINQRLDTLNGRVYRHEADISALKAQRGQVPWIAIGTLAAMIISVASMLLNYFK